MRGLIATLAIALTLGIGVVHAQSDVPEITYVLAKMDYQNIGAHECRPGVEVPTRFVVEDAAIVLKYYGIVEAPITNTKRIRIRKGLDSVEEVEFDLTPHQPSEELGFLESLGPPPKPNESGFFLTLDVTFCTSPFVTNIASGHWHIRHESGRKDLMADGPVTTKNVNDLMLIIDPNDPNGLNGSVRYYKFGETLAEDFGPSFGFNFSQDGLDIGSFHSAKEAENDEHRPFIRVDVVAQPILRDFMQQHEEGGQ